MNLLDCFAFGAGLATAVYALACAHRRLRLQRGDRLRDELIEELRREVHLWNAAAVEYRKLAMRLMRLNQNDDAAWWKQN